MWKWKPQNGRSQKKTLKNVSVHWGRDHDGGSKNNVCFQQELAAYSSHQCPNLRSWSPVWRYSAAGSCYSARGVCPMDPAESPNPSARPKGRCSASGLQLHHRPNPCRIRGPIHIGTSSCEARGFLNPQLATNVHSILSFFFLGGNPPKLRLSRSRNPVASNFAHQTWAGCRCSQLRSSGQRWRPEIGSFSSWFLPALRLSPQASECLQLVSGSNPLPTCRSQGRSPLAKWTVWQKPPGSAQFERTPAAPGVCNMSTPNPFENVKFQHERWRKFEGNQSFWDKTQTLIDWNVTYGYIYIYGYIYMCTYQQNLYSP